MTIFRQIIHEGFLYAELFFTSPKTPAVLDKKNEGFKGMTKYFSFHMSKRQPLELENISEKTLQCKHESRRSSKIIESFRCGSYTEGGKEQSKLPKYCLLE